MRRRLRTPAAAVAAAAVSAMVVVVVLLTTTASAFVPPSHAGRPSSRSRGARPITASPSSSFSLPPISTATTTSSSGSTSTAHRSRRSRTRTLLRASPQNEEEDVQQAAAQAQAEEEGEASASSSTPLTVAASESAPLREVDLVAGLWPRESRQLLALLGGLGFLETAFLTYQKLVVGDLTALCTLGGGGLSARCGDVLSSEYASFLGVPLTLPAMAAYGAVALLAARPLVVGAEGSRERAEADLGTRDPLLLLTTAMATFSAYLMWLLATQLKEVCPYCLASAALSFGMATLTWSKRIVAEPTKAAVYKGGSILVTGLFAGIAYIYASAQTLVATGGAGLAGGGAPGELHAPPPITTRSDERTIRLAGELQDMNARMYGAFWCSHCYDQKQAFGQEAYARINYIECAPDGVNSQTKLCKSRKVPGYPTWEIRGSLYPGEKSIDQLEEIVQGKVTPPPEYNGGGGSEAAAVAGAGAGAAAGSGA